MSDLKLFFSHSLVIKRLYTSKWAANSPPPFRPIVNSIGAYHYKSVKYLVDILRPCTPDKYSTQDSFSFVKEFQNVRSYGKVLISFDEVSLFTNIPLDVTINIAVDTVFKHDLIFPLAKLIFKSYFHLLRLKHIFCLMVVIMTRLLE